MDDAAVTRVGITGHQSLSAATVTLIEVAVGSVLDRFAEVRGFTSLAAGSDQIFARCVLARGGDLVAVIPSANYETSFKAADDLERFRLYTAKAKETIRLPFPRPSEEAYWAAGQKIVELCDCMIAVWDGKPAAGFGGTADVVRWARRVGRPLEVIWPVGAGRR